MDDVNLLSLIIVTHDEIKRTRQFFDIDDENKIKDSLDAVEEWCKKQDHLAKPVRYLNRNILERVFILAKGSIEETKKKVEKLLTYRGMMPELLMNRQIESFSELLQGGFHVPLPKLCPKNLSRVMVTKFTHVSRDFTLTDYFRYTFMIREYRLLYDYCLAETFVFDLSNLEARILTKLSPTIMKQAEILCTEGYGTKIKGIHLLNAPSFIHKFVTLIKKMIKEKIANRFYVHNSMEELHQHIPKDILPKDFGGDEPTSEEINERWIENFKTKEARKVIADFDKLVADESRRKTKDTFTNDYLGIPGSFRKIAVD